MGMFCGVQQNIYHAEMNSVSYIWNASPRKLSTIRKRTYRNSPFDLYYEIICLCQTKYKTNSNEWTLL